MPAAVESSGTQTTVLGTAHVVAAPTTAKTRQLVVDLASMVNGDVLELRIGRAVLAGGVVRDWQIAVFAHAQSSPVVLSVPIPSPHGATFTLTMTSGVAKSFPWSVEVLD